MSDRLTPEREAEARKAPSLFAARADDAGRLAMLLSETVAEIDALRAERDRLRKAATFMREATSCEDYHHERSQYHDERPCPIEVWLDGLLAAALPGGTDGK